LEVNICSKIYFCWFLIRITIILIYFMKVLMLIGIGAKLNQFWQQTNVFTVDKDKKLRNRYNIQQSVLNAASKTTVDTRMANTCCATLKRILYFIALHLHQPKISNLKSLGFSQLSPKYLSTSFFFYTPPFSSNCFLNWKVKSSNISSSTTIKSH